MWACGFLRNPSGHIPRKGYPAFSHKHVWKDPPCPDYTYDVQFPQNCIRFSADNRKIRILFLHPVMNLGGGQEPVPGKNVTDITFVFVKYAGISPAMLQFCSQCVLVHFQVPAHRTSMQTKLERDLGLVKSF